jgi:hypothetical protein
LLATKTSESKRREVELVTHDQALKLAEYKVSEAEKNALTFAATADAARVALGAEDPDVLTGEVDEALSVLARRAEEISQALDTLAAEATDHVATATRDLENAQTEHTAAKGAYAAAVAATDVAKAALNGRIGERNALAAQLDAMDRAAAAALCATREGELAALPEVAAATAADVTFAERACAEAQRELDAAKEDLHKSEGALEKVGGAAVRDEVERMQDALKSASLRERDLEVDAEAWKLLRDTLRDVENEEGAHLGRALAGPVATRFSELTVGRYKNLRLDAKLKTESVDVAAGVGADIDVLHALSVGTRDQLATLMRVTIADQLRTAIVLDDHLVHTDPKRLAWFRDVLTKTALTTQVIVLSCRPEDYLLKCELPDGAATRDLAGGTVRVVDMERVVKRWPGFVSKPPTAHSTARLSTRWRDGASSSRVRQAPGSHRPSRTWSRRHSGAGSPYFSSRTS